MKRLTALLFLALTGAAPAQEGTEADYALPPLDAVRAVAERPLFMLSRRGVVESQGAAPATPVAAGPAPLRLVGIGRRGDGQGVALLRQGGATRTLSPGQEWAGWRLVAVGTDNVDLLSPHGVPHRRQVGQPLSDPDPK